MHFKLHIYKAYLHATVLLTLQEGTCAGLELQEAGLVLLETVLALLGVWLM